MTTSKEQLASIYSCLDLTRLELNDSAVAIDSLLVQAKASFAGQMVAAVCVYPAWLQQLRNQLAESPVRLATVVNFPAGADSRSQITADLNLAKAASCDEIDLVFPYRDWLAGNKTEAEQRYSRIIDQVFSLIPEATVKVIIETGALASEQVIQEVVEVCAKQPIAFIKTSTGKADNDPDLSATAAIIDKQLLTVESSSGIKISGGVKSLELASQLHSLATAGLQRRVAAAVLPAATRLPDFFRIGASGLYSLIWQAKQL